MNTFIDDKDRFWHMVDAMCMGAISDDDLSTLETRILTDENARRLYIAYCQLDAALDFELRGQRVGLLARETIRSEMQIETTGDFAGAVNFPCVQPSATPLPLFHGTFGYLSSSWPVAYLVTAVIFAIGLLLGAHVYVSQPGQQEQFATQSANPQSLIPNPSTVVGRITGMADCQWSDESTATVNGARVALGRRYDLISGLMEITYETGARVILQGPATYVAESANGGFFSLGKLTGNVEAGQAKGFAVRTPTATVTDLGTEFGVEVDNRGNTTSHVFRGSVEVQTLAVNGRTKGDVQLLHASQSARVERSNKPLPGNSWTTAFVTSPKHVDFVRDIPRRTSKTLDLVDVVAGGNGFSGRRDRGIDPIGEQVSHPDEHWAIYGTYCYSRVSNMPFIDGIFIPDGRKGPVQTDSAGHAFAEFPKTDNCTIATPIWAGSGMPAEKGSNKNIKRPHVLQLAGVDYSQPGHGIVLMIPNQGITFDLDAIRRANPEWSVVRFLAVIANIDWMSPESHFVDFWVIVDGQRRGHFRQITALNKAIPVNVPIGPKDRFLTIATTDSGDQLAGDFAIFGDPRLELRSNEVRSEVPKCAGN